MADRKHRGDHGRRTEERAAARAQKQAEAQARIQKARAPRQPKTAATAEKPRRVFLRNGVYITLTILVIIGVFVALTVMGSLDVWDNLLGSIVCILVGAFGCMCIYDVALLMTACVSFGEGMVNAGKSEGGQLMLFHAASVVRVEMRSPDGKVLPGDQAVYKNADLTFVMQSGRVNVKRLSRLTQKQLRAVMEALEAEKKYQG